MPEADPRPTRIAIGAHLGLKIDCVAWDAVGADVDLSIAGMFSQDAPGASLLGGLLHLDKALGGALTKLRNDGDFQAEVAETLLLNRLPIGFQAKAILVVGLGEPTLLSAGHLDGAAKAFKAAYEAAGPDGGGR